jgi:hypothetical protein
MTTDYETAFRDQIEAVRKQVRQQYGRHILLPAPDGGCKRCPLSAMDEIHA